MKSPSDNENLSPSLSAPPSPSAPPNSMECSICGKMFGKKSIKIHEPQCEKKWQQQNELLPPTKRQSHPQKLVLAPIQRTPQAQSSQQEEKKGKSNSPKRPPMFPCYICGRLFGVSSIYIHEPQCQKRWKIENDKLPPNKRRSEPLKPDIKFTPDGKIDYNAMTEATWNSHLSQLIPCNICGRTFNPDRVDIHQRSCKG